MFQDLFIVHVPQALMSDPSSRFRSLHIDDMAETRAQRRRQQHRAGTATGRARGRATAGTQSAPFIPPILGHSGMQYSIQRLSPDSCSRANEGLRSDFFVDRLRSHETGSGAYYAFQLKKPVSVRVHDPANGTNRVECTCGDRMPCIHVYVRPFLQRY